MQKIRAHTTFLNGSLVANKKERDLSSTRYTAYCDREDKYELQMGHIMPTPRKQRVTNVGLQLMLLFSFSLAPLSVEQCHLYLNWVAHLKEHNLENPLQTPPDFHGDSKYCQDDNQCQPSWLRTMVCFQGLTLMTKGSENSCNEEVCFGPILCALRLLIPPASWTLPQRRLRNTP